MNDFHYIHSIEIRYGDLDPQGHVNNARYLTYFEQARIGYIRHLGLWDGESWLDIGIILAEAKVTFLAPARYGQPVQVGVRVSHMGNKSLHMEYCLEDIHTGVELASGSTINVTYDYRQAHSIPIPENWRKRILDFEKPTTIG